MIPTSNNKENSTLNVLAGRLWSQESVLLARPFDSVRVAFLAELSKRLLSLKAYKNLIAIGYWLRPAHLQALETQFRAENQKNLKQEPIGCVFQISPSNVEGLFLYCWALSFLCGNANIVRVSSKMTIEQTVLQETLNTLMEEDGFQSVNNSQCFVSYDRSSQWTKTFSDCCDLRVIWGGDDSIRTIRNIPLPAYAREVIFPDRYSCAVIDTKLLTSNESLQAAAMGLISDSFVYSQQACASPKWLFWVGDIKKIDDHAANFWATVNDMAIQRKEFDGLRLEQLVQSQLIAGVGGECVFQDKICVLEMTSPQIQMIHGDGVFGQTCLSNVAELEAFLSPKIQSLSVAGLESPQIQLLSKMRNVKQIVPLGRALEFDPVWDGINLFSALCRQVRIW